MFSFFPSVNNKYGRTRTSPFDSLFGLNQNQYESDSESEEDDHYEHSPRIQQNFKEQPKQQYYDNSAAYESESEDEEEEHDNQYDDEDVEEEHDNQYDEESYYNPFSSFFGYPERRKLSKTEIERKRKIEEVKRQRKLAERKRFEEYQKRKKKLEMERRKKEFERIKRLQEQEKLRKERERREMEELEKQRLMEAQRKHEEKIGRLKKLQKEKLKEQANLEFETYNKIFKEGALIKERKGQEKNEEPLKREVREIDIDKMDNLNLNKKIVKFCMVKIDEKDWIDMEKYQRIQSYVK